MSFSHYKKRSKILSAIELILVVAVICWIIYLVQEIIIDASEEQENISVNLHTEILLALIQKDHDILENNVLDYAHWDVARQKIEISPDEQWKQKNISESLTNNLGIDLSLVIDGNDQIHHFYKAPFLDHQLNKDDTAVALADWIKIVRNNPLGIKHPNSEFKMLNGKLFMLSASPLVSENISVSDIYNKDLAPGNVSQYVLVFGIQFDKFILAELKDIINLTSLELNEKECATSNCINLHDDFQRPIASLTFTQIQAEKPFAARMKTLSWPLIISVLLLGLWIIWRVFSTYSQLKRSSETDALTELYNRRAFEFSLKRLLQTAKRTKHEFSVMVIDFDHFKSINDTYGHEAGDRTLKAFSKLIQNNTRSSDVCARIGGEEFAILMPETSAEDAKHLIDKIRELVRERPILFEGKSISYNFSAGIAELEHSNPISADRILRHADKALYWAKRERNKTEIYRLEDEA